MAYPSGRRLRGSALFTPLLLLLVAGAADPDRGESDRLKSKLTSVDEQIELIAETGAGHHHHVPHGLQVGALHRDPARAHTHTPIRTRALAHVATRPHTPAR